MALWHDDIQKRSLPCSAKKGHFCWQWRVYCWLQSFKKLDLKPNWFDTLWASPSPTSKLATGIFQHTATSNMSCHNTVQSWFLPETPEQIVYVSQIIAYICFAWTTFWLEISLAAVSRLERLLMKGTLRKIYFSKHKAFKYRYSASNLHISTSLFYAASALL